MGGRCESCGGQVMSYRKYAFWLKPTAECQSCGAKVRLRAFWWVLFGGGVVLVGWVLSGSFVPAGLLALGALMMALDYGSYRFLSWHPEDGDDGAGGEEEAAD